MFDITLYLRRERTTGQGHEGSQQLGLSPWEADGGPRGSASGKRRGWTSGESEFRRMVGELDSCDR